MTGTITVEQVLAAKRRAVSLVYGDDRVPCVSRWCCEPATTRVFWPVLAGEQYPVYCDACAACAVRTLEALGLAAATERLAWRTPAGIRTMELPDEQEG